MALKLKSISSELLGQRETKSGLTEDIITYSEEVEYLKEYQSQSDKKLKKLIERVDLHRGQTVNRIWLGLLH